MTLQEGANYIRVLEKLDRINRTVHSHSGYFDLEEYVLKIIDRATGRICQLHVDQELYDMITYYEQSKSWGSSTRYDLCIHKYAKGHNPLYIVSPCPPKPLSAEDQELIDQEEKSPLCKIKPMIIRYFPENNIYAMAWVDSAGQLQMNLYRKFKDAVADAPELS